MPGTKKRDLWAARLLLVWAVLAQGMSVLPVNADDTCGLFLVGTSITDNGDGDGFADTHETLQIGVSIQPYCTDSTDEGLSNCVAWLSTESPAIDCMRSREILIGDLPASGPAVTLEETFEIKIGDFDRHDLGLGPDDPLEVRLTLDIRCSYGGSFDRSVRESLAVPLDLSLDNLGQNPTLWKEDFETGGSNPADPLQGTKFYAQNLDAGLPGNNNAEGLWLSDGYRCQYSDPDWLLANSYNTEEGLDCYPGVNLAQANEVFWQVDGSLVAGSPDGGRAYRGEKSMYYGIFLGDPEENFTTPMSTIESVATIDPINLGVGNPQLSFWQQISLMDHRGIVLPDDRSIDRGVVQIQLHDSAGNQISDWMNLQPIQNPYGQQGADNFFNCMFDPVDDGNDEDSFFDPSDPLREYGPSSTCFPSFSWANMGSTTAWFGVGNIGNASVPPLPSDSPDLGHGTWIKSIVDLGEFRGRRAKLRYIVTSLKARAVHGTVELFWGDGRNERDDGWWIDEIEVTETLAEPAVLTNDLFLLGSCTGTGEPCIGQCRSSLAQCSDALPCGEGEGDCVIPCQAGEVCAGPPPDCGADCSEAQVNLFVEPNGPLNPESVTRIEPGEPVIVNFAAFFDSQTGAVPSSLDACIDGYKEYRVCISGDPDGDLPGLPDADCDDAWDSPICESCSLGWSRDSMLIGSPEVVATYAVGVRCSSAPDCCDGRTLEIAVECDDAAENSYGLREARALSTETLSWRGPLDVDWLRGSFLAGDDIGDYVADLTDVASHATSIPMDGDPPAGTGYYYLVKADGPPSKSTRYDCGTITWRSGGGAEILEPARNLAFGDP